MKILLKQTVVKRKQVEHTKTERRVLGYTRHPNIVTLHYAFQSRTKLYFVLDYCAGGELFFHLGRLGRFKEDMACFYTAQLVLALGHLHKLKVVYRDMKPENVLLDSKGNIKIADFGLSKEGIANSTSGTGSFCGTPEYLAPEILARRGHGTAVDWWSLGMILYEMLTGLPPWYTRDRKLLYESIRRAPLTVPEYVSPLAVSVLKGLLERNPAKRLGGGPRDALEVMVRGVRRVVVELAGRCLLEGAGVAVSLGLPIVIVIVIVIVPVVCLLCACCVVACMGYRLTFFLFPPSRVAGLVWLCVVAGARVVLPYRLGQAARRQVEAGVPAVHEQQHRHPVLRHGVHHHAGDRRAGGLRAQRRQPVLPRLHLHHTQRNVQPHAPLLHPRLQRQPACRRCATGRLWLRPWPWPWARGRGLRCGRRWRPALRRRHHCRWCGCRCHSGRGGLRGRLFCRWWWRRRRRSRGT